MAETQPYGGDAFVGAVNQLTEEEFQALYGPWDPFGPGEIAGLLSGTHARWWIAGGRAARAGAAAKRHHEDTDVVAYAPDFGAVRDAMTGWHLWENVNGTLRPLLPGTSLNPECAQIWVRRDARQPWRFEYLLDRDSTDTEWVFKRDSRIRLPWERALHDVDGIPHLRPEVALLHKAHLDRGKDRADLAAAALTPEARNWLATTLRELGHDEWARLTAVTASPG